MSFVPAFFFVPGAGLILLANYWFIANTRYENYDVMGASISFDQPNALGAICVCIGVGLAGWLWWPICIALFFGLALLSLIYKWMILDPIVGLFRKPNPPQS